MIERLTKLPRGIQLALGALSIVLGVVVWNIWFSDIVGSVSSPNSGKSAEPSLDDLTSEKRSNKKDERASRQVYDRSGWEKLLIESQNDPFQRSRLRDYIRSWSAISFEDAWAACMEQPNYKDLPIPCLQTGKSENMLALIDALNDSNLSKETASRLLPIAWVRIATVDPNGAVDALQKMDSPGFTLFQTVGIGIMTRAPDVPADETSQLIDRLMNIAGTEYHQTILAAVLNTSQSSPHQFEESLRLFEDKCRKHQVPEEQSKKMKIEYFQRASTEMPQFVIDYTLGGDEIETATIQQALFTIGKDDLDNAISSFLAIDQKIKSKKDELFPGLVKKLLDYDSRAFGKYLNEMEIGEMKDRAIIATISFLTKREAFDEAEEWLQVIKNHPDYESLKKQLKPANVDSADIR